MGLDFSDRIKANSTHHHDQYHAAVARQFREMSQDKETFDLRSRRKYAKNAARHEKMGGR